VTRYSYEQRRLHLEATCLMMTGVAQMVAMKSHWCVSRHVAVFHWIHHVSPSA